MNFTLTVINFDSSIISFPFARADSLPIIYAIVSRHSDKANEFRGEKKPIKSHAQSNWVNGVEIQIEFCLHKSFVKWSIGTKKAVHSSQSGNQHSKMKIGENYAVINEVHRRWFYRLIYSFVRVGPLHAPLICALIKRIFNIERRTCATWSQKSQKLLVNVLKSTFENRHNK